MPWPAKEVERLKNPAVTVGGEATTMGAIGAVTEVIEKEGGGTAGWSSKGRENLLTWKYQLGWPAHSTSKGSR